jgi:glycosyltransferase involved in cell wall biosynthesis
LAIRLVFRDVAGSAGRLFCFPGPVEVDPDREWPWGDRSVASWEFDASLAAMAIRSRLQLLLECRRTLLPEGLIRLDPESAAATFAAMSRWAALVGLQPLATGQLPTGWQKPADLRDTGPLVSILIPSSNPRYFSACLDSAIAQTYPNIEIVICDDSEDTAIEAMVRSRAAAVPISFHRNSPRLRARRNYEKLLTLARGEYIKFLNDDDLLAPDCVARLLQPMLDNPEVSLATSHRQPIDADGHPLPDIPATRPVVDRDLIVSGISLANAAIMYGLNIIGEPSTMMLRRRDFAFRPDLDGERPFHFNGEEVRGAADLAMASRALVQGDAAFLQARLSCFRRHAQQAQARGDVVARSVAGIRGLQNQWIALGLFRRNHPNVLECREPWPTGSGQRRWTFAKVLAFAATGRSAEEDQHQWRLVRQHPFDHPEIQLQANS